jgi:hypothetical protein
VVGVIEGIADHDIVERPVRDVEDRYQVAALSAGCEYVLIAQHAEIRLAREDGLKHQRPALHERHLGLEAVLGEQVLAHGDVQRAGIVAVPDVGDAYGLLCGRARGECHGRRERACRQFQQFHLAPTPYFFRLDGGTLMLRCRGDQRLTTFQP